MKREVVLIILLAVLLILTSCKQPAAENTVSASSGTTSTATATPKPAREYSQHILFIGNSMVTVPDVYEYFEEIALSQGKKLKITPYCIEGAFGDNVIQDILASEWLAEWANDVDIVIFQDTFFSEELLEKMPFVSGIYIYGCYHAFYMPEYDKYNAKCINAVYGLDYMFKEQGFAREQIYQDTGGHPNNLFGFMAAMLTYCTIYDADCTDFEWEFAKSDMFGDTDEEKAEFASKLKEVAMQAKGKGFNR
ncbi:MAG TPA: hypothetical protein PLZ84_03145 [Clostridia bacterium]|nr:hypothetical protein [Clostridia bacterium]